jgi:hypothetical protein
VDSVWLLWGDKLKTVPRFGASETMPLKRLPSGLWVPAASAIAQAAGGLISKANARPGAPPPGRPLKDCRGYRLVMMSMMSVIQKSQPTSI